MTRVYALVNQKGGVGKTTTAINLGAYLAAYGKRVAIVDLDPQANATSSLGVDHEQVSLGTYDVLIRQAPPSNALLHNRKLGLSIIPSSTALAGAQVELVELPEREKTLQRSLRPLDNSFDYILIDCPPSLGLLTVNGLLAASHGVIIPIQCEYLALEGLTQLMRTLQRVRSSIFPELSIRGLLLTMYDTRTNLSKDVVDEVRKHFPKLVFETIIPRSVRLAEAPSHGLPISFYAPKSPGALSYSAFAVELLKGDGMTFDKSLLKAEA
ncbi:MAG: ParA family protein [Anaerolineales bacterium]